MIVVTLVLATALLTSGCSAAPGESGPGSQAEVAAALHAAMLEHTDRETADVLESEGHIDMVAADLVAMCAGEEPVGMGLMFLLNYGLDEVLAAGWDTACPGQEFGG